ncbi:OmpH family outer membrane protein [Paracoccus gahaiensis]|uniref:OmpH family outer membrane protein n=1 Tax=Paracoccus gahaiensis TaxID=1706839 RepID=A0A4U0RCI2_9RHOB|nr:OmpH family outer membrane protein [Paracoccus gahaiensis]TJZ93043.1 OmpH family outer membrane protein [Paracoccus gahaiensis]
MPMGRALLCLMLAAGPATAQQAGTGEAPAELPAPPGVPPLAAPPSLPNGTIAAPDTALSDRAPVLTLDLDLLYLSSAWGLRAQARLEAEGDIVADENERLTRLLSTEESQLTEQRATLPAAEFRRLAESFDLRATGIRRERAQAVQDLNGWAEADRAAFFRAALPVMGQVMSDRGAVAVLDRRTVFVSLDAIDVTQQLITTLDQRIGDGAGVVPLPDPDAPLTEEMVGSGQAEDSGQAGDAVPDQVE